MGSSDHRRIMLNVFRFAVIVGIFHIATANSKCNQEFLNLRCRKLFERSYTTECRGEELQLFPKCLFMASECKAADQITDTLYIHSANVNYSRAYDVLIEKVKLYRRCFSRNSLSCNESMIRRCYENFKQNKTKTCGMVHKLRFCILLLRPRGCHEMRNPWYTLTVGLIKNYRSCFIRNYTVLLEALQKKKLALPTALDGLPQNRSVHVISCYESPNIGYTFFGALFFCLVVLFSVVFLIICIKRTGKPLKNENAMSESQAALGGESANSEARHSRTCVAGGRTPLTYILEEDEAPPPYCLETGGVFVDGIESPPPYTSRPTSINGEFV